MRGAERNTLHGPVVGLDNAAIDGTFAWKGVPFARPPVGDGRWRAPVDPDAWTAPRSAREFGAAAAQTGRLYGPGRNNRYDRTIGETLGKVTGSEDCLYLNIWSPAAATTPVPVIVYVHGGSNITGYTADPLYEGNTLAVRANVVVVTVNYRLGVFGFLNLKALKEGSNAGTDSGNFALLDIVKALEFVRDNIANFGGDPGNVTLMGQSAGAVNVLSLMTSPLCVKAAPALFHRIVPISGGISLRSDLSLGKAPVLQPAATHLAQGNALLERSLVDEGAASDVADAKAWIRQRGDAEIAAWLRGRSAASLLGTVLERLTPLGMADSGPIPDGAVLPVGPIAAIRAGHYVKVPVLMGFTRDEGKLFAGALALSRLLGGVSGRSMDDASVFSLQYDYDPDAPPQTQVEDWIPARYLPVTTPRTGFNARTNQLNRFVFTPNRNLLLDVLRAQHEAVWDYQFDWDELPAPFDDIYGAAHGFDIPFMFGKFEGALYSRLMNSRANRPGRLALSDAMMGSLAAFAWHGDPNHAGLGTTWPTWPAILLFNASLDAKAISVAERSTSSLKESLTGLLGSAAASLKRLVAT